MQQPSHLIVCHSNECDRQHADAGIQAATEAKMPQRQGQWDLLTQGFWLRLQILAVSLPCTTAH
ncbi:MAG: hypothetical protein AAGA75_25140 [Cyanobacteria bacterium P01_E01_bin.6]